MVFGSGALNGSWAGFGAPEEGEAADWLRRVEGAGGVLCPSLGLLCRMMCGRLRCGGPEGARGAQLDGNGDGGRGVPDWEINCD